MKMFPKIDEMHELMCQWRHHLHRHPEIAFEERETSVFLADLLESFGLEVSRGIAETGIVATLQNGNSKRAIGLRADIDALPITELNQFDHASVNPGRMHACGHDGHMAMLLGAAKYLAENRQFDGTVRFIFQPAEESEGGAKAMIEEGLFERFPVDQIYGMHNWPDWPVGEMGVRSGAIMAARDFFRIEISGKGCHGAMPHQGVDPIPVAAQVVMALQTVVSRNLAPTEPAVVTVTEIKGGETWNAVPETVSMRGTARFFSDEVQNLIEERIQTLSSSIAAGHEASASAEMIHGYPPVINSVDETESAAEVAASLLGHDRVHRSFPPTMGAEDFAFMLKQRPGCYVWLGAGGEGSKCALHNPYYDFNDEALTVGAGYWIKLTETLLA